MSSKDKLDKKNIPSHVAVIMDGNGRWAKERGKKRIFGHKNGVQSVRDVVEAAGEIGISYLTLYAFSTENWNRPKTEVESLMGLLINSIKKEAAKLFKNNVRLLIIGDFTRLSSKVKENLFSLREKTKNNTGLTVVLALSYSSRWEITEAVRLITEKVEEGEIKSSDVTEELIGNSLATSGIPDPELLIRTSGEQRISNYLLWQIAYSELYFTETFWPDFRKENFFKAIYSYQQRHRRFGKTEEQIENKFDISK